MPKPNKTLVQQKVRGHNIQEDHLTLALIVNTTCTYKLKAYDYIQISMPKMLWKVVANKSCVLVCKPNGMDDIKGIWESDHNIK